MLVGLGRSPLREVGLKVRPDAVDGRSWWWHRTRPGSRDSAAVVHGDNGGAGLSGFEQIAHGPQQVSGDFVPEVTNDCGGSGPFGAGRQRGREKGDAQGGGHHGDGASEEGGYRSPAAQRCCGAGPSPANRSRPPHGAGYVTDSALVLDGTHGVEVQLRIASRTGTRRRQGEAPGHS